MSARPNFYAEGASSLRNDTMARALKKRLGALQDSLGSDSTNDGRRNDTQVQIQRKIDKVLSP